MSTKIIETMEKMITDGRVRDIREAASLRLDTKPLTDACASISEKPLSKEEIDWFKRYPKAAYRRAVRAIEQKQRDLIRSDMVKSFGIYIKDVQSKYPKYSQGTLKEFVMDIICEPADSGIGEVRDG